MPADALVYLGVKGVLFDDYGRILLVKVRNSEGRVYYDLPGGRLQEGEDIETTLRREIREEVGIQSLTIQEQLLTTLAPIWLPTTHGFSAQVAFTLVRCSTSEAKLQFEPGIMGQWVSTQQAARLLASSAGIPTDVIHLIQNL